VDGPPLIYDDYAPAANEADQKWGAQLPVAVGGKRGWLGDSVFQWRDRGIIPRDKAAGESVALMVREMMELEVAQLGGAPGRAPERSEDPRSTNNICDEVATLNAG
jgi:hypothetical protein